MINHNPSYHISTGAFKQATVGNMPVAGVTEGGNWNEGWGTVTEHLDASSSNSIYGNSTTVQPKSIELYFYIKY